MANSKREQLGITEVHFSDSKKINCVNQARQHLDNSNSLEELVFGWINPTRSVLLVNANCDPGEEDCFLLILRDGSLDLAKVAISMTWLKATFPEIHSATDWELDENTVSQKEWCKVVADNLIATEDNLKVIVSYLLAEYSQIIVTGEVNYLLEDCLEEELDSIRGRQLISVMPHYQNPKTGKGFGTSYWSAKNSDSHGLYSCTGW